MINQMVEKIGKTLGGYRGIKGFKAFDSGLKCRDFQYEVGKTYETDSKPIRCTENGFHFCENPFDVLSYYRLVYSRFCEVTGHGDIDRLKFSDSKLAVSKIHIGKELNISDFVEACKGFILDRSKQVPRASHHLNSSVIAHDESQMHILHTVDNGSAVILGDRSLAVSDGQSSVVSNTGEKSVAMTNGYDSIAANTGQYSAASSNSFSSIAASTGYQSIANNNGEKSVAVNTGDSSVANTTGWAGVATNVGSEGLARADGIGSVAVSLGSQGMAKGVVGSWLVLADWTYVSDMYKAIRTDVKCVQVDGKIIKANTLYKLEYGQFVEVEGKE